MTHPDCRRTFVNHIVQLMEDMDRWVEDESITKAEMVKDIRTQLLGCMRAGLVHPYTTFYSIEASTVVDKSPTAPRPPPVAGGPEHQGV
jgi:hypothetical protein